MPDFPRFDVKKSDLAPLSSIGPRAARVYPVCILACSSLLLHLNGDASDLTARPCRAELFANICTANIKPNKASTKCRELCCFHFGAYIHSFINPVCSSENNERQAIKYNIKSQKTQNKLLEYRAGRSRWPQPAPSPG